MQRWKKIFSFAGVSVLVTVAMTGCVSGMSAVDTSQSILAETGAVFSQMEDAATSISRLAGDAAINRAVQRVSDGDCNEGEDNQLCVVRFIREERERWYQLSEVFSAAHGTLRAWQQANDGWRNSGEQPDDWQERVCDPVGTMVDTTLDLLDGVGVDVSDEWRALAQRADDLCAIGVAIIDAVSREPDD